MNKDKYVFAQLVAFLDNNKFRHLVDKYDGNRYVKNFTCWNQLMALMFGQLCNRESLRDVVVALETHQSKCYHLGMGRNPIAKTTFATRNSTSNHNPPQAPVRERPVVSYRNSTSNHNFSTDSSSESGVVSYRNSTSNHNSFLALMVLDMLYLIEILHQTTTHRLDGEHLPGCILSKFYIKPQHWLDYWCFRPSCILSKFYIKPQPAVSARIACAVVSYRNSTSNHN